MIILSHYLCMNEYIGGAKNCVSREEFDILQKELYYWQNTTINLLKKYLIDNEGNLINHC